MERGADLQMMDNSGYEIAPVFQILNKDFTTSDKSAHIRDTVNLLESRARSNQYMMAIVGEFSCGKSTFINAIMGKDILMHATSETTASITYIHNVGDADNRNGTITINYYNAESITFVSIDKLQEFTTTACAENVLSNIASVEIFIHFLDTDKDLVLIDTPGLNGIADKQRSLLIREIMQAHSCVYLFQKRGMSEIDRELIAFLTNYQKTFVFVQNFKDELSSSSYATQKLKDDIAELNAELDGVLEYNVCCLSSLLALVGRDEKISKIYQDDAFDISSNQRKEILNQSGFCEFKKILDEFLNNDSFFENKYKDSCINMVNILSSIIDEERDIDLRVNRAISSDSTYNRLIATRNELLSIRGNQAKVLQKIYAIVSSQMQNSSRLMMDTLESRLSTTEEKIFSIVDGISSCEEFKSMIDSGEMEKIVSTTFHSFEQELREIEAELFEITYRVAFSHDKDYKAYLSDELLGSEISLENIVSREYSDYEETERLNDVLGEIYQAEEEYNNVLQLRQQFENKLAEAERDIARLVAKKNNLEKETALQIKKLGERPKQNTDGDRNNGLSGILKRLLSIGKRNAPKTNYLKNDSLYQWQKQAKIIIDKSNQKRNFIQAELSRLKEKRKSLRNDLNTFDMEIESKNVKIEFLTGKIDEKEREFAEFKNSYEPKQIQDLNTKFKENFHKMLFENTDDCESVLVRMRRNIELNNEARLCSIRQALTSEFQKNIDKEVERLGFIMRCYVDSIKQEMENAQGRNLICVAEDRIAMGEFDF